MVARRAGLEECMVNDVNDEGIQSLNKFLIYDHQDWFFVEFNKLPEDAEKYL